MSKYAFSSINEKYKIPKPFNANNSIDKADEQNIMFVSQLSLERFIKLDIIIGANCDIIIVIVPFHISLDYSFFVIMSIDPKKRDKIFKVSSKSQARK